MVSCDFGNGPHIYGFGAATTNPFVRVWNGADWQNIGQVTGSSHFVGKLIFYNDGVGPALYAFGEFTAINGVQARGFARWNGQAWTSPWSERVNCGATGDACVFDDGTGPAIYTTWRPTIAGAFKAGLHRWNGHEWTFVAEPVVPPFQIAGGRYLTVFDDGRGAALYMNGGFPNFQGVSAQNIVRYDGQTFEPLGAGVEYDQTGPGLLVPFNDSRGPALLVTGGPSMSAGGGLVPGAAIWVGCPNCYNNCDLSSAAPKLNVNDFMCFLNAYARRDPYANCNVDAVINVADFICFMNKFAVGCP